jgi:hypothetical protein
MTAETERLKAGTKLTPHLAFSSLSMRQLVHFKEVKLSLWHEQSLSTTPVLLARSAWYKSHSVQNDPTHSELKAPIKDDTVLALEASVDEFASDIFIERANSKKGVNV